MKASALIKKLKSIDVPFDASIANGEFGEGSNLTSISHGVPFIVLKFGEGKEIKTDEAIALLEELVEDAPFDPTISNARQGDNHKELKAVYHSPPVTVLDF